MESITAKVEQLKAALDMLDSISGAAEMVLMRRRSKEWQDIKTVRVSKACAKRYIARALMLAAGLDPDGNDGVRLEPYMDLRR